MATSRLSSRDGIACHVEAAELVPGDIVLLDGGDIVAADLRLIEAAKLQADESTLTGESLPITKSTGTVAAETLLMDRDNMLFKGTAITRGSGRAVVVGTGLGTELGRISKLVTHAEPQRTPLEKRLDVLAQRLVWAVLALAATIAVAGILAGRETVLAIEVAIALAVAAIPGAPHRCDAGARAGDVADGSPQCADFQAFRGRDTRCDQRHPD